MAHIVARSTEGPRGQNALTRAERDHYDNLILLCPNCHADIDDVNPGDWPVELLHRTKREYEDRVRELVEKGRIEPFRGTSAEDLVEQRLEYWKGRGDYGWVYVALSPLALSDEIIDPMNDRRVLDLVGDLQLRGIRFNGYRTQGHPLGLVNEDLSRLDGPGLSVGFSLLVSRQGFIEIVFTVPVHTTDQVDETVLVSATREPQQQLQELVGVLAYSWMAKPLREQVSLLHRIWREAPIPTKYMVAHAELLGFEGCALWYEAGSYDQFVGRTIEADDRILGRTVAALDEDDPDSLAGFLLQRLVNGLGFQLSTPFDEGGNLNLPRLPR